MGCSTSSIARSTLKLKSDAYPGERAESTRKLPVSADRLRVDPTVDPETGEYVLKIAPSSARRPRSRQSGSIVITDSYRERPQTDEEPAVPLPAGELGDLKLGSTDHHKVSSLLSSLRPGELFNDPDFPADDRSLFYSIRPQSSFTWKRPKDIVHPGKMPRLLVDGISKNDIKQGDLADCWFLSACAAVSREERFMRKIIPQDCPLAGPRYTGIVWFRLWRFGEWVNVYVDDRLPINEGKLVYAHGEDHTEFWVALLEKAYAKIHGSYEAIEGGQTMDALVDLTGGLAERYDIKPTDPSLFGLIVSANKAGSFIACSKKGDWRLSNTADPNGLVAGHAYTITDAIRIRHKMGSDRLLRIRNPWGNETEWKGSWSDNDSNWEWLDNDVKNKLGFCSRPDGEFWMSYKDFVRHFQEITICTVGPDFDCDGSPDTTGTFEMIRGEWVKGRSAGGSRNDLESFATNPQFVMTLPEPDTFDPNTDDPELEGKCRIIVSLMQEHRRSKSHIGVKMLQIGFILYKTDDPTRRLPAKHFRYNYDAGKSGTYINYREVSCRFELLPGHYVIIPSTFQEGDCGSFLIRIFSHKPFRLTGPLPDTESKAT